MTKASYTEKDITAFKRDTDKIRAKPQLYIGPTDDSGVFTLVRECADNAVDEARAGRNSSVEIYLEGDGSFVVADAGVGIPVKRNAEMGISTLTHVFTNLQSSGKMKKGAYDSAIGTHGVGIKATNALSSNLKVWTYRADAGGWHSTAFAGGIEREKVAKSKPPKLPTGKAATKGTVVQFKPDPKIFGKAKLPVKQLLDWCSMTSYMNAGLRIGVTNAKGQRKEFYSKDGIASYLAKRCTDLKATSLSKKPVFHVSTTLELALHFADVEGCEVEFFTNTIRNVEWGVHADAFFRALVDSLKPYKGRLTYMPTDLREGLVGVLNYKVNAPQFDSQTKEKLVDGRVKEPCYKECLAVLKTYWEQNKTLAKAVSTRAAEIRTRTADFLKDKALIKGVKKAAKTVPAKLADVERGTRVPLAERELYIVEGDSAGGTATKARIKDRQGVWPIRGKVLNVMRESKAKVVANAEIAGIFAALGLDLGKDDPIASLKFGRVLLMADPDVDGSHINCLLSSIFWMYTPDLLKQGRLYVVVAPEYLARHKGRTFFGVTKEALYRATGSDKVVAQHIKGWGEINDTDLYEAAMSLSTRRLYRVLPPTNKKAQTEFELLMREDSAYRKQLLGIKL